jgi:hypothetical protein
MNVLDITKNYFNGFNDVSASHNSPMARCLGALKIFSYFTVVLPLIFGAIHCFASLSGRAFNCLLK